MQNFYINIGEYLRRRIIFTESFLNVLPLDMTVLHDSYNNNNNNKDNNNYNINNNCLKSETLVAALEDFFERSSLSS